MPHCDSIKSYRTVTIQFHTFALGGLSSNDFVMAAKTDRVPVEYSPKWLREHPEIRAGRAEEASSA